MRLLNALAFLVLSFGVVLPSFEVAADDHISPYIDRSWEPLELHGPLIELDSLELNDHFPRDRNGWPIIHPRRNYNWMNDYQWRSFEFDRTLNHNSWQSYHYPRRPCYYYE